MVAASHSGLEPGCSSRSKYQSSLAQRPRVETWRWRLISPFSAKKTQQPCIQIDKRLASPDENQSLVMAQPDPVQVNIFGLIRVVCTENVLPIWQIWTTSAERSWQILPELVASYPKRLETFCWNHLRIIHIWFLISVQLRAAAAHTISKGTNLFLERYPVGFASQSQSDVSRKWGWPDEKSAWSKSLWFILQGPGTRKAAHMSQKPSVPAGFLFKRKIRILRFGKGWHDVSLHAGLEVTTPLFVTL